MEQVHKSRSDAKCLKAQSFCVAGENSSLLEKCCIVIFVPRSAAFRCFMVHLFSLLHSMAVDSLHGGNHRGPHQSKQQSEGIDDFQREPDAFDPTRKQFFQGVPLSILGDMDKKELYCLHGSSERAFLVMVWIRRAVLRRRKEVTCMHLYACVTPVSFVAR